MKIMDILDEKAVSENLKANDVKSILDELSEPLIALNKIEDKEKLIDVLLAREELGSTGIGDGVAIPHGKLKGLEKIEVAFGRSIEGVDFKAIDGQPVHLFFLLVAPEGSPGSHLKVLARVSRLLKDSFFREALLKAKSKEEIVNIITEEDAKY